MNLRQHYSLKYIFVVETRNGKFDANYRLQMNKK